jgi:hypothetical protein
MTRIPVDAATQQKYPVLSLHHAATIATLAGLGGEASR